MDLHLNEEILVVFPLMPRWKCADQHQESNRISPPTFIQDVQQSNNFLHIWTSQCCPLPGADANSWRCYRVSNKEELCCHLVAMDIGWRIGVTRYTLFVSMPQSTPTIISHQSPDKSQEDSPEKGYRYSLKVKDRHGVRWWHVIPANWHSVNLGFSIPQRGACSFWHWNLMH